LSGRERTAVAAYLAVNMPLPAEAAGRADPGAALCKSGKSSCEQRHEEMRF